MIENVDQLPFDKNAAIVQASIEQHARNRNEVFRQLGLLSVHGSMEVIDPEKLYEFVNSLKQSEPDHDRSHS